MSDDNNIRSSADLLLVITPPFFIKMPHIGVAYLESFLTSKGFNVNVSDLSLKLYNMASQELRRFWRIDCVNSFFQSEIADMIFENFKDEIEKFIEELLVSNTAVIGFSVNLISIYLANRMAKKIKQKDPNRLIVFGGPGTFFNHPRDLVVPSFADIYVLGEGELPLYRILEASRAGRQIKSSCGIMLASDLGRGLPVQLDLVGNLDELPHPTFSGFDLQLYNPGDDYKPIPLILSRGCIRRCAYCIDYLMWPKYRFRSASQVMDEISYHISHNRAAAFEMIDLTCNGNLVQLAQLCDLIIASGLKFNWVSYAIIRQDMDERLLVKMKRAGCHTLIYGVENGSDKILKKMGKGYTAQEASLVIRRTHQAGICVNINIIVGFPGETEEDFNQTIEFIHRNRDYIHEITNVSACTLFPMAELGRKRQHYGVKWQEGTDPMLFRDSNGLDREARNERVARLTETINSFKLAQSIVNKPSLNPEVKFILERDKQ